MFNYIPEKFAPETADTIEEGERWLNGDKEARRPPELLTRDVVAKAIMKEVKAGRGSKNGGAYLDIASRQPSEHIKKKLPSMYHQFKELAEVDITKEPMEVGPTLHYFMGGIRVNSETQQTNISGLFACGECAGGMHGANRLGSNSLLDLIVFGRAAANYCSKNIKPNSPHKPLSNAGEEGLSRLDKLRHNKGTIRTAEIRDDMQRTLQRDAAVFRTGETLERGINKITKI